MPVSPEGLPSVELFARNVTDREGLGFILLDTARSELGTQASEKEVGQRATKLLLESLLQVGISPRTEIRRRERLFQLLRGDPIADSHVQECVEYILSQMVVQPKGALAECLAIKPCIERLHSLQDAGKLPANACFGQGAWSHRLTRSNLDGMPTWGEWREAADGLFYCSPTIEQSAAAKMLAPSSAPLRTDNLVILGAVEIKCFRSISRRKLDLQLDAHLARLTAGLQFRSASGEVIHQEFSPNHVWFGVWTGANLEIVPASSQPFRLAVFGGQKRQKMQVSWTNAIMQHIVRLRVGPRAAAAPNEPPRTRCEPFDIQLPFDDAELEEMGAAMAFYTLGALADQPQVDLSDDEWGWYMKRALETPSLESLSQKQLARREKILRRLG